MNCAADGTPETKRQSHVLVEIVPVFPDKHFLVAMCGRAVLTTYQYDTSSDVVVGPS